MIRGLGEILVTDDRSKLLEQLDPLMRLLRFERHDPPYLFRGEPASYDSCLPNIDRLPAVKNLELKKRLRFELDLMRRFREVAVGRLNHHEHTLMLPATQQSLSLDLQVVMRHRGIPTRLLDWSHSPLVAMYFACLTDPNRPDEDGLVRWFYRKTTWSGEREFRDQIDAVEHDVPVGGELIPVFLHESAVSEYLHWIECWRLTERDGPTLYPRVREQRGNFTFAGLPGIDHWFWIENQCKERGNDESCGIIRVPSPMKTVVRELLRDVWNLSARTLFPDPEGVTKELEDYMTDYLRR